MKLLILQHVPHEHPGYIADYANEKGITIDLIKLWHPYSIPAIGGYSGIIIMGGPMGVYEEFPSKGEEIALIQNVVGSVPVLGICLGSQLLAHALGAKVYPNPGGKEIGYYDLKLTEAGKKSPALKGFPANIRALEWHGDAFELPVDATLFASSAQCENQAFSFKNAYGFLFHFEFTPEMVRDQIAIDREWIHKDFILDEAKVLRDAHDLADLMKKQCYRLLDNVLQ